MTPRRPQLLAILPPLLATAIAACDDAPPCEKYACDQRSIEAQSPKDPSVASWGIDEMPLVGGDAREETPAPGAGTCRATLGQVGGDTVETEDPQRWQLEVTVHCVSPAGEEVHLEIPIGDLVEPADDVTVEARGRRRATPDAEETAYTQNVILDVRAVTGGAAEEPELVTADFARDVFVWVMPDGWTEQPNLDAQLYFSVDAADFRLEETRCESCA